MARKDTRTDRESLVIRIDSEVQEKLSDYKLSQGSWNKAIKHVVRQIGDKVSWALPSDIYNTKAQAKGEALKRSVLTKEESESPVPVRPLDGE